MSNTHKNLADLLKVCSILPALVIMPAMATDYTSSDIEQYPYTVKTGDTLLVTKGYSNAENGVFHNNGSLIIGDGLAFIDNNTKGYGATIYLYNKNATYTKIGDNVVFAGGTALEGTSPDYEGMAGAIYSWSDGGKDGASGANVIEMGNNVTFRGNSAVDGSVMYTYGYNTITIGDNLVVEGNTATGGYGAIVLNGYDAFYGNDFVNTMSVGKNALFKNNSALLRSGAVYIGGDANDKAVFDDGARFVGNRSSYGGAVAGFGTFEFGDVSFESNVSFNAWEQVLKDTGSPASYNVHVGNGGAVLNRGGFAINGNANFLTNKADSDGGAIYNGGDMTIAQATFDGNIAGLNGGAIYNYGTMDLGEAGSTFKDNMASISGGAIYNLGDLTIKNGDFENNKITSGNGDGGALYTNTGALTLKNVDFENNFVTANPEGDFGYGGAIYAQGGTIDIQGGEYENNHALTGGAIYVSGKAAAVNIENVEFEGNWASDIGALGIFGKNATLTNLTFTNNYTTGQYKESDFNDGGGALFFGATAQAVLDNGTFVSNKSAGVGGAIATRSPNKGDNSAAKLDIKNSVFRENIAATQGGAIYTAFHNSKEAIDNVYLADSVFVANKANEGGAVYNEGLADRGDNFASIYMTGVTFKDNVASVNGGAVFNGAGGTINLSGINVFSGNVAHGLANDIHNMGTLNITGGTTSFGGGVTGTGTLNLAQGAKLDLGTAAIKQTAIDLQGTVAASLLNDSARGGSYGRFIGDVTIGENAMFELNVGAAGTYNIWDGKIVNAEQVSVGDIYEIAGIDVNGVKIVTKSVDEIAETVGVTTQTAGVVAGLANSHSGKAHQVSLALQDALNSGDIATVEKEAQKLNPTDKPVAQAATSSMQNQVLALTAGRMAGGVSVGRAGGDERSQENGFWIQGLFNKSKFGSEFHGYTRGVALGADTLIDRKWTIGGGLAFNNSDVHADDLHTDIDSKTLFLYGQYKPNNWFVNATATYSMSEYTDNKVFIGGVDDSYTYDVDAYGAQVMTGYDFAPGITTEAGVRYLHIAQDGYTNSMNVTTVKALDTDFLTGVAGLKYAFAIENDWAIQLRPELRAAMTYDIISDDAMATVVMPGVASYKVAVERLSRMGGEFGIGLTAQYKGVEVSLVYDLDLHRDYTSQTGMIKFRGKF